MFGDSPSFFNKECLVSSPHNGDVLGVVSGGFERGGNVRPQAEFGRGWHAKFPLVVKKLKYY